MGALLLRILATSASAGTRAASPSLQPCSPARRKRSVSRRAPTLAPRAPRAAARARRLWEECRPTLPFFFNAKRDSRLQSNVEEERLRRRPTNYPYGYGPWLYLDSYTLLRLQCSQANVFLFISHSNNVLDVSKTQDENGRAFIGEWSMSWTFSSSFGCNFYVQLKKVDKDNLDRVPNFFGSSAR